MENNNQTARKYIRVSTDEQNLQRQSKKTTKEAKRHGFKPTQQKEYSDKSTGTNTNRKAFQQLLEDVDEGDHVFTTSVSRIARSIRDLEETAQTLKDEGATLHTISEGFTIKPNEDDPFQKALFQLLGVFSELEAQLTRQRVRDGIANRQDSEEYHHGRAPLGFTSDNGKLYPNEHYERVCEVLKLVEDGDLSKRKASKELNTSRATINRRLNEKEMYGLKV